MIRLAAAALVLLAATAAAGKARPMSKLTFTVATSADKSKLVVDIRWRNTTKSKVYLVDKLIVPARGPGDKFTRSDRITVMNSDDKAVASFVLGAVSSDTPSYRVYEPTYAAVAPGAEATRHFELPLPLTSWNPVGGTDPLSPETSKARLMVFGFSGEPRAWTSIPTDDPTPIKVPEIDRRLILEAGPVDLPAK